VDFEEIQVHGNQNLGHWIVINEVTEKEVTVGYEKYYTDRDTGERIDAECNYFGYDWWNDEYVYSYTVTKTGTRQVWVKQNKNKGYWKTEEFEYS
jgi:hypothetical protein